jgi:hypothetical protein
VLPCEAHSRSCDMTTLVISTSCSHGNTSSKALAGFRSLLCLPDVHTKAASATSRDPDSLVYIQPVYMTHVIPLAPDR